MGTYKKCPSYRGARLAEMSVKRELTVLSFGFTSGKGKCILSKNCLRQMMDTCLANAFVIRHFLCNMAIY